MYLLKEDDGARQHVFLKAGDGSMQVGAWGSYMFTRIEPVNNASGNKSIGRNTTYDFTQ